MAASVQYRQQEMSLGMVSKEKDDDLALFLQMGSLETERIDLLLQNSDDYDEQLGLGSEEQDGSLMSRITSTLPPRKTGGTVDEFLHSENDKTDYDWLLTAPGTPRFPSLDMESQKTLTSQIGISNGHPASLKSTPANPPAEHASGTNETSRQPVLLTGSNSSTVAKRRSSLSGGLTSTDSRPAKSTEQATASTTTKPSRSSTPTSRATLTTTAKPSRSSTPTSRATLTTTAKPSRSSTPTSRATVHAAAKPSRPSTPTSRATLPSTKAAAPPARSSTPTRSMLRSSTPTARPTIQAASKSTSRSGTPAHRPSLSSSVTSTSGAAGRSSSVTRSGPTPLKDLVPSRGTSPTVKSRPRKPSEISGFSHDTAPNPKTSMPERPASASRGRPGAPSARSSSSNETSSNGRPIQQSRSPLRRAPNGSSYKNGISVLAMSRAHSTCSDDVNPVLIGTQMVERVVNMRKLLPPKQDDHISKDANSSGKSLSSQENSGFGRTLSKKSFDMAMRHMDIRRSIPGNLRPLVTNVPASSVYSVRSGSAKSTTASISDSLLATSSNASSEPSVNNNSCCLDGSEDNYFINEREHSSPASLQDG